MRIFSDDLPAPVLTAIRAKWVTRSFGRGETVVFQGDPNSNVYLIESGHVSVKVGTAGGLSVTVAVLGSDESFGELAELAGDGARSATVVALDELRCHIVAARGFEALRATHPEIDRSLLVLLAKRLVALNSRLAENVYETVQRRCARRLLEVALKYALPGMDVATVPLTQDDLAAMSGATRPTTNQALALLAQQGLVRLARGRIEIVTIAGLRNYVR